MRLSCPLCGARDVREFTYKGDATLMARPSRAEDMQDYVHIRDNIAGDTEELWHHVYGCSAWLKVVRNTLTHEIRRVDLAKVDPAKDGRS